MKVEQIDEGLWRWTAPHPAWAAGKDWDEMVGCIYYEAADDAIVLIDPLAPPTGTPEAEKFWAALDRDVERLGLPVATVIANRWAISIEKLTTISISPASLGEILLMGIFPTREWVFFEIFRPDP